MKYRSEIDGLRAVAVLPVLLFHAKVPGFSGGYVGVDIFFVISGFLITGILLNDLQTDNFSILRFYERRARRILPALFAVALATFVGAYALMTPDLFSDFGRSLVALGFFGSNVLFWWESGYFEPAADEKPLLHTWSLSVEEQFYIFFPALLFLLWRMSRRREMLFTILSVISLISLGASQLMATWAPTANFYLLPSRVWELMLGSMAAVWGAPQISKRTRSIVGWGGLLAILVSVACYSEATPFPSFYALLPVMGTTAILMCADSQTYPGRLLSAQLFVSIGLISYSLYLWHQPLLAFYRIYSGTNVTISGMAVAILLSIPLAWLSWRYIEAPFRKSASRGGYNRKAIFTMSAIGIAAMIGVGGMVATDAIRLPYSIPTDVTDSFRRLTSSEQCFDIAGSHKKPSYLCVTGDATRTPDFLLIGDSHGLSVKPAFDAAARAQGRAGWFVGYSGCPPLLGLRPDRRDQNVRDCEALVERAYHDAAARGVKNIILAGRWDYYLGDGSVKLGGDVEVQYLSEGGAEAATTLAGNNRLFARALDRTVAFASAHGMRLHIIAQVPHQVHSPQAIYYAATRDGAQEISARSISEPHYRKQIAPADTLFKKAARLSDVVSYYGVSDIMCDGTVCPVGEPNRSYYFDEDHLSLIGAARLQPVATKILNAIDSEGLDRPGKAIAPDVGQMTDRMSHRK